MSQSGSIRRRGGTWTAYWRVDTPTGRHQSSKGGFPTKRDAREFLTQTMARLQSGTFTEPSRLTVGEYLTERWLPAMRASLRPSTFDSYSRNIKHHIVPALGGVRLQILSADQLDRFYAEMLSGGKVGGTGGLAPKTVRYLHTILHKALHDALRKSFVVRNVADAADPPRAQSGEEMRVWTVEQLRTFLEGMREHWLFPAFVLAATTGMRRGEILGLRWVDIDLAVRRLNVRQTVIAVAYELRIGTPKTARGRRSIALDHGTAATLAAHRARQASRILLTNPGYSDQGLVFAREDGSPVHPHYFSQTFDRSVVRLGLPRIRLHDLRHTYASLGLAAGVPAKLISERLGHSTVAFTLDIYTHVIPRVEEAAAEQLGRLVLGSGADSDATEDS